MEGQGIQYKADDRGHRIATRVEDDRNKPRLVSIPIDVSGIAVLRVIVTFSVKKWKSKDRGLAVEYKMATDPGQAFGYLPQTSVGTAVNPLTDLENRGIEHSIVNYFFDVDSLSGNIVLRVLNDGELPGDKVDIHSIEVMMTAGAVQSRSPGNKNK
jgi:hypothetical protein